MKKNNNKGFTLVELIVVLVILAILAAILVPALLGYIDKAREKQITTNAEAAYVAAQALATEAYGKNTSAAPVAASSYVTAAKITQLTDIDGITSSTIDIGYGSATSSDKHAAYIIETFKYAENEKEAVWTRKAGVSLTVTKGGTSETVTSTAGGWVVGDTVTLP